MSQAANPDQPHRPVRSFVLRKGRLTRAQSRAMKELWPKFGIEPGDEVIDASELFGRDAPLVVEIGFGNGEATWQMAQQEPDKNFIGIEVHPPGVGHLLLALDVNSLENVRIVKMDAVEFLEHHVSDGSVSEARIYFPDPWPKKRHHKRRIIQANFLKLLSEVLAGDGVLHIATDWQPYAEHILEKLADCAFFENLSPAGDFCDKPGWRPPTKYERRGLNLGHRSFDLLFRRTRTDDQQA